MLVTITQGARELGVSVEHMRRQLRTGRWPSYKLGPKATRVDVEEIRNLGRLTAQAHASPDTHADGKQTKP